MKKNQYCIIKTTCKTNEQAKKLAQILLEAKLVACAQISTIQSLYIWKNKIQEEKEFLLTIKTKSGFYKKIEKLIIKNHSYKIPQIIKTDISEGFSDYLAWLDEYIK